MSARARASLLNVFHGPGRFEPGFPSGESCHRLQGRSMRLGTTFLAQPCLPWPRSRGRTAGLTSPFSPGSARHDCATKLRGYYRSGRIAALATIGASAEHRAGNVTHPNQLATAPTKLAPNCASSSPTGAKRDRARNDADTWRVAFEHERAQRALPVPGNIAQTPETTAATSTESRGWRWMRATG
jgi:hypothetical protein